MGTGKDDTPDVVAPSGGGRRQSAFATELARLQPSIHATGGVNVTSTQIDGPTADDIIVGSGPGIPSEVKVFSTELPAAGSAPALFATFSPYPNDLSGVTLASGFVDFASGRNSIVTAPGPGTPTQVKVFSFSLMTPLHPPTVRGPGRTNVLSPEEEAITSAFMPFGLGYRDGVSLATGWVTGAEGGAEAIVVGQLSGPGTVKIYSSGSALQGGPAMYLESFVAAKPQRALYRGRQLRPVRRRDRSEGGHDQHDGRGGSPRQRCLTARPNRAGSQIPAVKAKRRRSHAGCEATRPGQLRCRF